MSEPRLENATPSDAERLLAFLFEHARNPWNYLPEQPLREHFAGLADGKVEALMAYVDGELAGFVSFQTSRYFARYQPAGTRDRPHGYISEAAVHPGYAGKGLGSLLLGAAVRRLEGLGVDAVFIDRHEENAASAGMMRKAGFVEVDTYADPDRRPEGSGRTTVCVYRLT